MTTRQFNVTLLNLVPRPFSGERWRIVVNEWFKKGKLIYLCELCGYGYTDLDTAELCEQHCYSGNCSIQKKAIYKPKIDVLA